MSDEPTKGPRAGFWTNVFIVWVIVWFAFIGPMLGLSLGKSVLWWWFLTVMIPLPLIFGAILFFDTRSKMRERRRAKGEEKSPQPEEKVD